MKKIYKLFVTLFIFTMFTENIKAENIYYFVNDNLSFENAEVKKLDFISDFSTEEKAVIMAENLIERGIFPTNTHLISLSFYNGELFLNFSEDIKNYGGTFEEIRLIKQIVYTFLEMEEVEYLTVFIDNKLDYFPEGSMIYRYDKINAEGEIYSK